MTNHTEHKYSAGALLPCPFCGHVGITVIKGSTFRWRIAQCNNCGAQAGDVRHDTLAKDQAAAETESTAKAIEIWNERPKPAYTDVAANLAEALRKALPSIEQNADQSGYGFYRPENPHDFCPDGENSPEEHAAHKAACEAYDNGTYVPDHNEGWIAPGIHVTKAPWGTGSYTCRDPELTALVTEAKAFLAAYDAAQAQREGEMQPPSDIDWERGRYPGKVTQHWLRVAFERIAAGEPEVEVLDDYGYTSQHAPAEQQAPSEAQQSGARSEGAQGKG